MTLRELFQLNPVLTTLGIILVCFILVKIIRGKPAAKKQAEAVSPVQELKAAAVTGANTAVNGDIIAAITAAVTEYRKKGI